MKTAPKTKIFGFHSGHDIAYCILEDGIPVLHEEQERITRHKMEHGDGLKFLFSRQKKFGDINYFTFGNFGGRNGRFEADYNDKASDEKMKKIIKQNKAKYYEFGHHLSHAANAFFTSDFDKALIITVDGGGWEEDYFLTALTVYEGKGNKIKPIKIFAEKEVNLGRIYNRSTKHLFHLSTGFPKGNQAGTVMAMATLGKPKYTELFSDYDRNWPELRRIVKSSQQERFNVAASLQNYTERTFRKIIKRYIYESGHENVCFSGGVSLNCVMIGKMRQWFPQIKNMFCDPVPYDAGLALGSARYLWHQVLGNPRIKDHAKNMSPYLGKTYSKQAVTAAVNSLKDKIKLEPANDEEVLKKIYDQKIVAVFGGGSESGRRALGNRSILADPRSANMKDLINQKIKHREWFRPVAPSILEEKVSDWFDENVQSPYMSFAIKFKSQLKDKVPAVVHFDGTGRLQTVSKSLNPWYHNFLKKWEALSGVPILINTSFNDREPISETPQDALSCFLGTEIDHLYFFDHGLLVSKA